MKARAGFLGAALLAGLAGCGPGYDRYADAAREQLGVEEEFVAILRTVRDDSSMKAARARLQKLERRAAEAAAEARRLPAPSGEVLDRLLREFADRRQEVLGEKLAEVHRIEALPGGQEFVRRLEPGA